MDPKKTILESILLSSSRDGNAETLTPTWKWRSSLLLLRNHKGGEYDIYHFLIDYEFSF